MNPLIKHLGTYAAYHRDPRNIFTHFFGVPMILFAIISLFCRPGFDVGGVTVAPAWVLSALVAVWYLKLDVRFGITMALIYAACIAGGTVLAAQSTAVWLGGSIGLFVVGWVIQFIGHYYEGKKPAFMDDLRGLLVGPMFVTAEIGFALGLRHDTKAGIEKVAGPVRLREMKQLAAK